MPKTDTHYEIWNNKQEERNSLPKYSNIKIKSFIFIDYFSPAILHEEMLIKDILNKKTSTLPPSVL